MRKIDEETHWDAVQARDSRFNGIFVYGVRSTGIYCKPSCPSRRPRKEQVEFFSSSELAEAAGFRACRRCRPQDSDDAQVRMVKRACRIIESQTDGGGGGALSLAALSSELSISQYHLQRTFKRITGVTPRQYAAAHRSSRFREHIRRGETVAGAMYDAGYSSSSRLYEKANSELGMTPAVYRRGGVGTLINYTVASCAFGYLLVAATELGICAVRLGDSDKELEDTLFSEFSTAEVRRDESVLSKWVEVLLHYLEGQQVSLELPLDVQATAFQRRVWEKLREIPYGVTCSYGDIARAIGQPTATRAVAQACAANPLALVTPCHRVIREDGSLSGYRWGIQRKKKLLEQERNGAD